MGVVAFVIYIFMSLLKWRKLRRIGKLPFKEEYKACLFKTPHYKKLSDKDKEAVQRSILLFINTKNFIGIKLQITDEVKIIIAFYACLLLLHVKIKHCYNNLKTIIVYPSAVVIDMIQSSNGIYNHEKFLIDGRSTDDTVIIVWHDAKSEAYHLRHDNVIIHEFAHEIDFLQGEINGIPPIEKSKYHQWATILFTEFNKLNKIALKNRDWGKYKLLGSYASTNEAEFFAVLTERFFEAPKSLKTHFPKLYDELKEFYNIDTVRLLGKV